MIRITLISTAIAIRAGLRSLLNDDSHLQVIGEAATPADLEDEQANADVVIWSPGMPADESSLSIQLSSLKLAEPSALLLLYDEPGVIAQLNRLHLRAWGLLSQESTQAEILAAIEAIHEGLVVTDPTWLEYLSSSQVSENDGEISGMVESLTGRELEILQLLALGLTNKQIALKLGISAHTVKFHVSSIFGKMGTTNRTETVKLGLKMGLVLL